MTNIILTDVLDVRIIELSNLRLKHILDTNSMKAYAFNEGKKEGIKQITKNLISKGLSIEEIKNINFYKNI